MIRFDEYASKFDDYSSKKFDEYVNRLPIDQILDQSDSMN